MASARRALTRRNRADLVADLSCTNSTYSSTQEYVLDVDHQRTDLVADRYLPST
jgi:hypothetical protein